MQVDLTSVAPEVTHDLWKPIEGGQVGIRDFSYLGENLMGTFRHIFGKSNNTTAVYTQGYLHLFLTITATRSASSAETKEEIVSKYVIALNEVK